MPRSRWSLRTPGTKAMAVRVLNRTLTHRMYPRSTIPVLGRSTHLPKKRQPPRGRLYQLYHPSRMEVSAHISKTQPGGSQSVLYRIDTLPGQLLDIAIHRLRDNTDMLHTGEPASAK